MHGKTSRVAHDSSRLFAGLTGPFEAGRYHSLVIPRTALPPGFVVTAWVEDNGLVMGVEHERHPVFGVQFHPESVLTTVGHRLLQNFLEAR
jgi:anthranilate/para-aminobenzoate synthase component II